MKSFFEGYLSLNIFRIICEHDQARGITGRWETAKIPIDENGRQPENLIALLQSDFSLPGVTHCRDHE
jgi:hypothetical protein